MEFFIELISEIFLEGFVEFAKSERAPKLFRVFVFTILIFLVAMLLYLSYIFREDLGLMLFMGSMGFILLAYTINLWTQIKAGSQLK